MIFALVATICGGLILAAGFVVDVPAPLDVAGWLLFTSGVIVVLIAAMVDAKRRGDGTVAALARGIRTAGRWILEFLP